MAYQFRAGNQPGGSNASTSTFTIPATAQIGDLCIGWWVVTATVSAGPTPPTGWNYLGTTDSGGTASFAIWGYWKILVSGDPGTTITFSSGTTRQQAGCACYYEDTGVGLTVENANFAQSLTLPTLTTVAANCFGVAIGGERRGTGIETFTPPSGWVERLDSATDASTGGKSSTEADKLAAQTAGTNLGGVSFVGSGADRTNSGSIIISVKPTTTRVTRTGTASYDVKSRVSKTGTASFDVKARVTGTGTATYNVLNRVTGTGTATYNVGLRGTRTGTATYNVGARVTQTGSVIYSVGGRVTGTGTLTYNVLVRVGPLTGTLTYNVGLRNSTSGTATYNVASRVTRTGTASFDVKARIAKNGTLTYDVIAANTRVTRTGSVIYDVSSTLPSPNGASFLLFV